MSQMPSQPPPFVNYASPGAAPPKPKARGLFGWVLFIGLAVMLFLVLQSNKASAPDVPVSEFFAELAAGNLNEVVVDAQTLRGRLVAPRQVGQTPNVTRIRAELPQNTTQSWAFMDWLIAHRNGAVVRVENNQNLMVNLLLPVIPWLLIFAFLWFFIFRQLRQASNQRQQPPRPAPVYIVNPEQK